MNNVENNLLVDVYAELHLSKTEKNDAAYIKRRNQYINDKFDIPGLKKSGMFPEMGRKRDYDYINNRICTFFGMESIFNFSTIGAGAKGIICNADGTATRASDIAPPCEG